MSKFKIGDRVAFTECYGGAVEGDQGTVRKVRSSDYIDYGRKAKQVVTVELDKGGEPTAFDFRMELVQVEEQEAEAQPVTFRICVGTTMGTTEYPSLEAAKEAALTHGNAKEEFSIFEVVKIADYRVKVTKDLEIVEAA